MVRQFTDGAESIVVTVGEEFALRLGSTPTTGYRWAVVEPGPSPDVVQLVDEVFEAPASDVPGAGGAQVFRLRAVGPGSAEIGLRRARPWEGVSGAGPDALFSVMVR